MLIIVMTTAAALDCAANAYIGRPVRALFSPVVVLLVLIGAQP